MEGRRIKQTPDRIKSVLRIFALILVGLSAVAAERRALLPRPQEIHYAGVMKAILETGYKGFVGQEFIPTRDKVASLSEAVKICDV